jgi:2-polyprenyl-3-methyl-5-hydroxy-6-metoxy-1,4-benzoquinol methylase
MKDIIRKIKSSDEWYQTVNFDGFRKRGHGGCGDDVWPRIRSLMPASLKGLKILDLGSNAGIFCVRAAIEGATAVGIEKKPIYLEHSNLVRSYFEKKHGKLDITILEEDVRDVLYNNYDLGKFDIVLSISVLYHIANISKPDECIKLVDFICSITDEVIARYRGPKYYEPYHKYFKSAGFKMIKEVNDKPRHLFKYRRVM